MSDDNIIKDTIVYSFSLICPKIVLTQKNTENPTVYKGSGEITQNSKGVLSLKLCHLFDKDQDFNDCEIVNYLEAGKVVPDNFYYDMECMATNGCVWTSEKIYIEETKYHQSNCAIIEANIKSLRRTENKKNQNNNSLQFLVKNYESLPCNEKEELGNGGFRRSIFKFSIGETSIEINNSEERLNIYTKLSKNIDSNLFSEALLYALSILVGKELTPIIKIIDLEQSNIFEINSIELETRRKMPRPVPSNAYFHYDSAEEFLEKFVSKYLADTKTMKYLIGYWHKVYFSYNSSIEVIALTLTTSIEGLVKNLHSKMLLHDEESQYISELNESIYVVKKIEVDKGIRNKLLSMLGGFNRKSIKSALTEFTENKPPYKDSPKVWASLRNQSAHADSLNNSNEELQSYFDKTYNSLGLFYLLILDYISYVGKAKCYSINGWPEINLQNFKENNKKHKNAFKTRTCE